MSITENHQISESSSSSEIVAAGQSVASYAIVVHAKDAGAVAFYGKHGFIPFPDHPKHLFLPVATAQQLFR